jgi:hypothetical protein
VTATIQHSEPTQFVAGDSLVWTRTLSRYPPSDGWSLHYRIVGPYELASDPVVAVVDGAFQATLAASATAAEDFIPGSYRLLGWVDGVASERHVILDTFVEILPNVAVVTFASLQTHEERVVAACEAAVEGRLGTDVARYGREGAFIEKLPIEEVRRTLGIYKAKLWRIQNPGKLMPVHGIRFGAVSSSNDAERLAWPGLDQ